MSLVFLDQSSDVVLVVYLVRVLPDGELLEEIVLSGPQRDALSREQLMHHVFLYVPEALGVEDLEGVEHALGRRGLELVAHEHLEHVGLEFLVLDVVRGLIILQFGDNVVADLRLGGELQEVSHDVRDFSIKHM